jgi:hypothetical protein
MTPELEGFDARALAAELDGLDRLAARFGATMVRSFGQAAASGRGLGDVLRGLALSLSAQALSAGLAPLSQLAGSMFAGIAGNGGGAALSSLAASASGAVSQLAAPAARPAAAPAVTVTIQTPDAESFRRSQSQVASSLARGVSRGLRNL